MMRSEQQDTSFAEFKQGSVAPFKSEPRLLTLKQAAAYLGCSTKAVRAQLQDFTLKAVMWGKRRYFTKEDLEAAIAARRETCPSIGAGMGGVGLGRVP